MAAIATAATKNTTGTGVSHTGPATVWVRGTLGGATVTIQVADEDVPGSFVKADNVSPANPSRFSAPGVVKLDVTGTYFIRAVVTGGDGSTSVNVNSTQ